MSPKKEKAGELTNRVLYTQQLRRGVNKNLSKKKRSHLRPIPNSTQGRRRIHELTRETRFWKSKVYVNGGGDKRNGPWGNLHLCNNKTTTANQFKKPENSRGKKNPKHIWVASQVPPKGEPPTQQQNQTASLPSNNVGT